MKRAVIFDLDGTIVTTEAAWDAAAHDLLRKMGISQETIQAHQKQLEEEYLGAQPEEWASGIQKIYNLAVEPKKLFQDIQDSVFARYDQDVTFIQGFERFIKRLEEQRIKRAIATNSDDKSLNKICDVMRLRDYFGDHIYGVSRVSHGKPNPAIYLHAAESLQVQPAHCIAIEDSAIGIAAAKGAGMYCIGMNSAGQPEQLESADSVVQHYDEIDGSLFR